MHQGRQAADDRQTQAEPPASVALRIADLVVLLEYTCVFGGRDAHAGIDDIDPYSAAGRLCLDCRTLLPGDDDLIARAFAALKA